MIHILVPDSLQSEANFLPVQKPFIILALSGPGKKCNLPTVNCSNNTTVAVLLLKTIKLMASHYIVLSPALVSVDFCLK